MGVAINTKDSVGQTTQLVDWITKVRCKKISVKNQRRKNLLVQAVLSNALMQAELELRRKQQQRFQRWQQLKNNWCSNSYNNSVPCSKNIWSSCEEITSLDHFLSQLKSVKAPLER